MAPDRPNILFFFSDQHRGDWMPYAQPSSSPEGDAPPLRMPNIRSLMDRGTTFTRAATNSPLCVPARACLALGQDYEHCGAWNNDFCCPLDRVTFYRVLREGGYAVSGVGKFDLHKPILYWGEQGWIPQLEKLGFTRALENEGKGDAVWAFQHTGAGPYGSFLQERGLMEEYCADHLRRVKDPLGSWAAEIPEDAYADNWVTENALTELRCLAEGDRPWFLMVNFSGPHDPWDVTQDMKRRWEHTPFPIPEELKGPADALTGVRQNYAAMLENIDRCIGVVLDEVDRLKLGRETVVIYSADHGEMLGDRNRFFKSVPYQPAVHIPLVISGPGVLQNNRCGALVQLHDLAATITGFAGLSMPPDVDSKSLLPLAANDGAPPVRGYQYAALYTHMRESGGPAAGYEEYAEFQKRSDMAEPFPTQRGPSGWRSVITERFKYVEYLESGRRELYDLLLDGREMNNITDEAPALVQKFQTFLAERFPVDL